jgi:putative AbiEi antitoxin of type IV toxin-antitoxin system
MDDPLRFIARAHGVFLRREALECGYDDKGIATMVRAGAWHRVRHGCYCFADVWATYTGEERHLCLARAVLRSTPGPVVLSHTTALLVHGIAVWGADLTRVHVTRLDKGAGRRERDVEHHVGRVLEHDLCEVDGLPAVTAARAVIEAATLLSMEAGLVSADSALHRRKCTPDELQRVFERLNHWPGSQGIHVVLHHMDGRAESPGETRSRVLFRRQGLPRPELQFEVYDANGRLVAVTDFVWHEKKAFGEFDGKVKYGRLLKPGQDAGEVVFQEKQREDLVRSLTGYGCGRLVWVDLSRPDETGERFRRLLG